MSKPGKLPLSEWMPFRAYSALALLTIVYTFNFMDRQLLSILAEPIKRDMHLSDTQLGLLGGIFFALFYTTLGIPLAWYADRAIRVRIVAVACATWSLFSMGCGLAGNFGQLALARIGVGAGEAGASPPSHSIISDYFPPARRGTALAIYSLGVPLGILLASMLGGWIAAAYGWRMAFLAIGAPGVGVAAVVAMVMREPQRGASDVHAEDRAPAALPIVQTIRTITTDRTLVIAAAAAAASAFVGYAMTWMATFLIRNKGMELQEIALWFSLVTGIGSMIGTFSSGWISDRLAVRYPGAYGLVPCLAHLISLPLFLGALWAPTWQIALALYLVPAALSNAFLAPGYAIVQNRALPSQRAMASALLLFTLNFIGLGGGPLFVGLISDHVETIFGRESLTVALTALTPFFLLAAFLHYSTARSLLRSRLAS